MIGAALQNSVTATGGISELVLTEPVSRKRDWQKIAHHVQDAGGSWVVVMYRPEASEQASDELLSEHAHAIGERLAAQGLHGEVVTLAGGTEERSWRGWLSWARAKA